MNYTKTFSQFAVLCLLGIIFLGARCQSDIPEVCECPEVDIQQILGSYQMESTVNQLGVTSDVPVEGLVEYDSVNRKVKFSIPFFGGGKKEYKIYEYDGSDLPREAIVETTCRCVVWGAFVDQQTCSIPSEKLAEYFANLQNCLALSTPEEPIEEEEEDVEEEGTTKPKKGKEKNTPPTIASCSMTVFKASDYGWNRFGKVRKNDQRQRLMADKGESMHLCLRPGDIVQLYSEDSLSYNWYIHQDNLATTE